MQLVVFLFGNVDMPDAGYGGTEPQERRYGQADVVRQYDDCFAYAVAAERLGYDALWLTEHHFQHEGYEVVPNIVLLSAMIAMKTERIKLGGMFHVIPQWHPLRFAEDFAMADVVSRGRMICGIGRGTVPRESTALGARTGWNDSADICTIASCSRSRSRSSRRPGITRRSRTGASITRCRPMAWTTGAVT